MTEKYSSMGPKQSYRTGTAFWLAYTGIMVFSGSVCVSASIVQKGGSSEAAQQGGLVLLLGFLVSLGFGIAGAILGGRGWSKSNPGRAASILASFAPAFNVVVLAALLITGLNIQAAAAMHQTLASPTSVAQPTPTAVPWTSGSQASQGNLLKVANAGIPNDPAFAPTTESSFGIDATEMVQHLIDSGLCKTHGTQTEPGGPTDQKCSGGFGWFEITTSDSASFDVVGGKTFSGLVVVGDGWIGRAAGPIPEELLQKLIKVLGGSITRTTR
jgi:hypothetical protein